MSAEGSSYIRHQIPNAERLAGCTIRLFQSDVPSFEVRIIFTGWSGVALDGPENEKTRNELEWYSQIAVEGVKEFAAERDIDLTAYTIELSRFLYHLIDTNPRDFKRAGRNAFAAAWAALHGRDL